MRAARFATAIAAALLAVTAYADRYEHTITRSAASRGTVKIDHSFGTLLIRNGDSDRVLVKGIVRSSEDEFGRRIDVTVSESANAVIIETHYPESHMHGDSF